MAPLTQEESHELRAQGTPKHKCLVLKPNQEVFVRRFRMKLPVDIKVMEKTLSKGMFSRDTLK